MLRILTFNWHEAYLCLLAKTNHHLTVVDKDKGGYRGWIHETRPVPPNVELLPIGSEHAALERARAGEFDLAIGHNLQDLAQLSKLAIAKIIVFHNRLSTELELFGRSGQLVPTKEAYAEQFLSLFDSRTRAVFISESKRDDAASISGHVIAPGIDLDEYGGYRGEQKRVLRVGNFFTGRDLMLGQTAATTLLGPLPVTVLGINRDMPDARLSTSWEDLKEQLRSHRVLPEHYRGGL